MSQFLHVLDLCPSPTIQVNHGSAVNIATGYGLDDRGVGVRVPVESPLSIIQTISGAHTGSYPMGARRSFPGGGQGHEADHLPITGVEVKKTCIFMS
jgi:hypothetical protein